MSARTQEVIPNWIMYDAELRDGNLVSHYEQDDFSNIWMKTENYLVFGIIGEEHNRIRIKILSANQSGNKRNYKVVGKSCVNGNVCEFSGVIDIVEVRELKELSYGVDDEYKNRGIRSQGLMIAEYFLEENAEQKGSGIFKGRLYTKWYKTNAGELKYNDIDNHADDYMNNTFVGNWKSYKTGKSKICSWGDYRVPNCKRGFDVGAAEFSPSGRYKNQGWADYQKAWNDNDQEARLRERKEWWK